MANKHWTCREPEVSVENVRKVLRLTAPKPANNTGKECSMLTSLVSLWESIFYKIGDEQLSAHCYNKVDGNSKSEASHLSQVEKAGS